MRWSELQKLIYSIWDPKLDLTIHCTAYRSVSMGVTRYWIKLDREIIWDVPRHFPEERAIGPYAGTARQVSVVIKHYLGTPREALLETSWKLDRWGILDIMKAADRRIGQRRLAPLYESTTSTAARRIIEARLQRRPGRQAKTELKK